MPLVRVDSRIRLSSADLPRAFLRDLRAAFTHANPDFSKKKSIGFATYGTPRTITTFEDDGAGTISIPRGGTVRLRTIAAEHGVGLQWKDLRTVHPPVDWPTPAVEPRWYQSKGVEAGKAREQGIIRLPTGSGKTTIALLEAAALRQPTLVIMRDSNLLDQWKDRAVRELRLSPKEIGHLQGTRKLRVGPRLTLALAQTLSSDSFPLDDVVGEFGCVLVDEVQGVAAKTFQRVIDKFACRYRLGYSADETRKDGKQFLIYDMFGPVVYALDRAELENEGVIVPVRVRMIPTDFRADWYRDAVAGERDFNRFLEEATADEARNAQILGLVRDLCASGEKPVFVFSHRVEHARWLADVGMFSVGVRAGLMLGGPENKARFREDKIRLEARDLDAAAGTYNAIGTGIDVPAVAAGVMSTPIGNNAQFFNQVRGRICRPADGKDEGFLYVLWDRHVFPNALTNFRRWVGRGLVEVADGSGGWLAA